MSRLRVGEWTAVVGSVGLLIMLFLDWFSAGPLARSGWGSLGWFLDALLVLVIFGGLSITYMTLRRTSPAWPVGAAVLTALVGGVTFLVLLVRVVTQPALGADLPNHLVSVELAAYVGLLFAALIPVGAWLTLRDERLDAPESAYTPPPARAVPGT
jgi:hypothetical protein